MPIFFQLLFTDIFPFVGKQQSLLFRDYKLFLHFSLGVQQYTIKRCINAFFFLDNLKKKSCTNILDLLVFNYLFKKNKNKNMYHTLMKHYDL